MTIPRCTGTPARRATLRHAPRGTACETEDVHAGARTRLVDFIVHRAFYPVLMADRSELHGGMIGRMKAAAWDAIDRFRAYRSAEEVIDGFQRGLGSKSFQADQSELRLLHLPVIDDLRDDFDRRARELGFEPETLLTSLCSTAQGHMTMDQERISGCAYALWEKAGQPDGAHDEHWQQACREIEAEDGATISDATPNAEMIPAAATHPTSEAEDQGRPPHPETTERR